MGKSALAFEMAARVAGKGHGVGVISLEMSPQELVARDLAAQIGVTENAFLVGSLDGQKFSDAVAQVNATGPIPLLFPRRHVGRWGLRDVEREARRFKAECEKRGIALALLVVDYIGLLRVDRSGGLNHAVAVAELADGLKALARELGCCVLAACQLNRGVESRTNKRPRMSDLRDSGGLEQAADVVLLLYRDGYYDRTPGNPDKHILEVNVAKHRQGPTGNTYVTFAPGTFQVWREPTLEMIAGWRERLGGKLNGE
jgi:replicative DNA helicase